MVYLDYNASTPIDRRILPALMGVIEEFGNPSSAHSLGAQAGDLVSKARSQVASLVGRPRQDVIFTSGATEACVIGLVGAMLGAPRRPNVVISATEHKAVIAAAEFGARLCNGEVRTAAVDRCGRVDLDHVERLVDDSVSVLAVMAANNETGVTTATEDISAIANRAGVLSFVDCTQMIGKSPVDELIDSVDLAVFSSHKIYGPKGAGALVVNRHLQKSLVPIFAGGSQERGLRGGTHNTQAVVGFGLACELVKKEVAGDAARMDALAGRLIGIISSGLSDFQLNSGVAPRLSNTLNVRFVGADAEAVMAAMPTVCVSAGSACQAASPAPSHVLTAMGLSPSEADETLRISLGRPTTAEEVEFAGAAIVEAVSQVRELNAA